MLKMRLFISAAALLFVLLTLTSFFSEAGATKHIPAKIKQLYVKSEVYENDLIHVQCVVDYHEPGLFDEILVEVHRSLFNSTENQVLSLNGEIFLIRLELIYAFKSILFSLFDPKNVSLC